MTSNNETDPKSLPVDVAVIGAGYWGKNHVRNFAQLGVLSHICEADQRTAAKFAIEYPDITCGKTFDQILETESINAVVIATPAVTHFELASKALRAGKDVLVEKPMALTVRDGEELLNISEKTGRILMVGHILLYHPAVVELKRILDTGELGKIQYIQSNRLSMGKVRSEENILWSFAPHDVSTILYLLGETPEKIYATGYCHLQHDVEDVTISVLDFPSGVGAHIYVSWMNPFKEQRLVIMGDKKMAVFEDSRPDKRLRIFNNSFEWICRRPSPVKGTETVIDFEESEPLANECRHFVECVATQRRPRSDGREGLEVLRVLHDCYASMKKQASHREDPKKASPETKFLGHETAIIDDGAEIGAGTSIWHFSHIMRDARIGENCRIGQNCFVGQGVRIGNNCKIQNNVSIYEGIVIEDHVFCGPSMVFTNVYNPRCEIPRMNELRNTLVKQGATIGANATIRCGAVLGKYSFIGAGAVVLNDVPNYALMAGNPASRVGWMCRCGVRLHTEPDSQDQFYCSSCNSKYHLEGEDMIVPNQNRQSIKAVPLLDLKRQYLSIKAELDNAISDVVASQRFIGGPQVDALEEEARTYCGVKHAIGVSSGTDALLLSLMSLGIGPGDEVITTPFTFFATVGSILRLGAKPVFADIDPLTFNLDPKKVSPLLTDKTRAIIPVHLFGQCTDMDPLLEMTRNRGIAVIEDAAQAIGSQYKGKMAGALGTLGCFSFFPSKNLGAFGDGGMVITNDDKLADKIKILKNQGAKPKYYHILLGGNFRLDAIQAAVLRVKLKCLDQWSEKRRYNADYYTKKFSELGLTGVDVVPPRIVFEKHVFNQFVIRADRRDSLREFLTSRGIGTEIYYPYPMHLQACLKKVKHQLGDFPETERACDSVLALPIYPELEEAQMDFVISHINEFYELESLAEDTSLMAQYALGV